MLTKLLARYYETKHRLQRLSRTLRVPSGDRVLDIGSGDSPFAPADAICEKFPWDDRERTAAFEHDRPLVVGDAEALPFRDKAFDFIHCSHVLEHTLHPDQAIEELMRVGKRGYIEVPSAFFEKTCRSFGGHLWFITLENGVLVFRPKPRGVLDEQMNRDFDARLANDPHYKAYHYVRIYDLFHIGLRWEGTIRYRVEPRSSEDIQAFEKGSMDMSHGESKPSRPSGLARSLKRFIRKASASKKKFILDETLACPLCRGALARSSEGYQCSQCQATYPLHKDVPVLLKESARLPAKIS
jgi:uncharacterized protein YbaR (Trm112 family)/SAM-dependent methyltransferase